MNNAQVSCAGRLDATGARGVSEQVEKITTGLGGSCGQP